MSQSAKLAEFLLSPLPLLASHSYDLTRTWLIAIAAALSAPPLLVFLCRRQSQFSLRELLLAVAIVAIALSCIAAELQAPLRWIGHSPKPGLVHPGEWWYVPVALGLSSLFTWAAMRQRDAQP